jgi:hypothetical protein
MEFDEEAIKSLSGQAVPVGDGAALAGRNAGPEIGLAVAPPRDAGVVLLALTDAGQRRVLELPYAPDAQITLQTFKEATGTFVGEAALEGPTEVACMVEHGELREYAVDGHHWVVRLR